jgi:hypothetical protein
MVSNIPQLLESYNIFYSNQVYTYSKRLVKNVSNNVITSKISISDYINKFVSIYETTYPTTYLLKNVILDQSSGLVFFSKDTSDNIIARTDYIYYYINILNPSPIELINSWILTIDYSTSGIQTFINNFLYGGTYDSVTYEGYLKKSGSSGFKNQKYVNGGLYPNQGNSSNPNNAGFLFYFYNSNKTLNSIVYCTLESIKPSSNVEYAYGVSLIILKN